jgi:predicted enzyme involved in methoxymalonyl-ACP biosynthesis
MDCQTVCATYIPTPKNEMVREFYGRFGFVKTIEEPNRISHWSIDTSCYQPEKIFIQPDALSVGTVAA